MIDETKSEILIVDDTPANLKLLTSILLTVGYRIRPASSSTLALRSVAAKAPDLILLDVRMPNMDGYAVCRQLKADPHASAIPVIFISALNETTDKVQGFAAGAVDYITKPFEPAEVLVRVRTHLELRHLQQQLEQRVAARTVELAQANQALQRYRDHLEELVAARTAELQRTNEELHRAMNQLVQAEKLAALGHLVAGVAHELNTPLGNARTMASALDEHLSEFAVAVETGALRRSQLEQFLMRSREAVGLLERNTARAANLITHFKQVAVDQTSMRRRRFDLRQTIEETLITLQPQFKHSTHQVKIDIPAPLELDSYPGPLEQIIANLVSNSLSHGFTGMSGGTIRINAAAILPEHIQIKYQDNGAGIPENIINRIFEPFFTTKLGSGGSGLGLYIVYNLVIGVLGGTIQSHSAVGQGVQFTLTLPRTGPDQPIEDSPHD
jgi:signal transduction histidine kinase